MYAHIFMTPDQIKEEIKGVVALIDKVYGTFGFPYKIELSTMPEDHMGELADWERATDACVAPSLSSAMRMRSTKATAPSMAQSSISICRIA